MAKRKVKKKISKRAKPKKAKKVGPSPKKIIRSVVRPPVKVKTIRKKFSLVLTNLVVFLILFVASTLLYLVSNNVFSANLFYLLAILFGGISIAFLITLLVFLFIRVTKK